MNRPPEPPPPAGERSDPMAALDAERCDTRALDLGAVRAIHAASTGLAVAPPSAVAEAPRSLPPLPQSAANDGAAPRSQPLVASEGDDAPPPLPPPLPSSLPSSLPSPSPSPSPSLTEDADAVVPSRGRSAPFTTLEIDYSPATRRTRERSAKVQRAARVVLAACLAAALVLGAWVLLRGGRVGPPVPSEASAVLPAGTIPTAAASTSTGLSSSAFSTPERAPKPQRSTIPTPPPELVTGAYAAPAPGVGSAGGPGVSGGPLAGPGVVPRGPATVTVVPPGSSPPGSSRPVGTVDVPILE